MIVAISSDSAFNLAIGLLAALSLGSAIALLLRVGIRARRGALATKRAKSRLEQLMAERGPVVNWTRDQKLNYLADISNVRATEVSEVAYELILVLSPAGTVDDIAASVAESVEPQDRAGSEPTDTSEASDHSDMNEAARQHALAVERQKRLKKMLGNRRVPLRPLRENENLARESKGTPLTDE